MTPVSICTIVKNEEKYIEGYLKAIKKAFGSYPHEALIVDTGSTDRTVEIAQKYADSVYYYKWNNSFCDAKNFAISKSKYDIILNLDCDEFIKELDVKCFDLFESKAKDFLGVINIINHLGTEENRYTKTDSMPRVFSKKYYNFIGNVHEQLRSIDDSSKVPSYVGLPLSIDHYGYMGPIEELAKKVERNNQLMFAELEASPDDPYIYYQIGKAYSLIDDYQNAATYFGKGLEYDVNPRLSYVQEMVIGYGYALLETDRAQEALSYEGIYEDFKEYSSFHTLMGMIYLRNNMLENAYKEFLKAVALPPENPADEGALNVPYYNLGVINEVLGNIDEAKSFYKKCINYSLAEKRLSGL